MTSKPNTIIVFGEYFPNTKTGVSLSNYKIHRFLFSRGVHAIKIEEYSWNKPHIIKVLHYLGIYFKVIITISTAKVDVFYFNIPMSFMAMLKIAPVISFVTLFSKQTKVYAHLHRGDFLKHLNANKKISSYYLKRIDKLIVLSDKFKKEIQSIYQQMKIDVLHNTSEFEKCNLQKNAFSKDLVFLCAANYIESKGIRELVKCFGDEKLKNASLNVYGSIYDKQFYNQLKKNATPNVKLNGALSREEIVEKMITSDCLILPSWNEGQPIVLLEAMSVGLPVIATNVGDVPNMLGPEYKFLLQPKDESGLLKIITKFMDNTYKEEISNYLYKRYKDLYSNAKFEKGLERIFLNG